MNYRIAMVLFFIFYTPALCGQNKPFTFVPAEQPLSLYKALAYDIVPGGGHIYTQHYEYAAVFATLKISGVYAMYYYYGRIHSNRIIIVNFLPMRASFFIWYPNILLM